MNNFSFKYQVVAHFQIDNNDDKDDDDEDEDEDDYLPMPLSVALRPTARSFLCLFNVGSLESSSYHHLPTGHDNDDDDDVDVDVCSMPSQTSDKQIL